MKTLVSFENEDIAYNMALIDALLSDSESTDINEQAVWRNRRRTLLARTWVVAPDQFLEMLGAYRWAKPHGNTLCAAELEFLRRNPSDPDLNAELEDWLVIAPMLAGAGHGHQRVGGKDITVIERGLLGDNSRLDAMGEPRWRDFGRLIIGDEQHRFDPQPDLPDGLVKARRGVLCLYVIKPKNQGGNRPFQIGLEFLMPSNTFEKKFLWGVRRPGDAIAVENAT
jgi:hypothetical protein